MFSTSQGGTWFDLRLKLSSLVVLTMLLTMSTGLVYSAPTTPASDFTDNGDGTVTHKTTDLVWKRCAEGMTWSVGDCTGTATTHTWEQAAALTSSFAGKSDWRLPTIAELATLVERENYKPSINTTIFPRTPSSFFWTASASSSYVGDSVSAWHIYFINGLTQIDYKVVSKHVRLVRGGQLLDSSGVYTRTSDFNDNGDGTVTHKKTGLTWKRCSEGQAWSASTCSGTASTHTWAEATAYTSTYAGTNDWRLPTANELLSIVEWSIIGESQYDKINKTIFPRTPREWYWTASPCADSSSYAWRVDFDSRNSTCDYAAKTNRHLIRLVRGTSSAATSSIRDIGGIYLCTISDGNTAMGSAYIVISRTPDGRAVVTNPALSAMPSFYGKVVGTVSGDAFLGRVGGAPWNGSFSPAAFRFSNNGVSGDCPMIFDGQAQIGAPQSGTYACKLTSHGAAAGATDVVLTINGASQMVVSNPAMAATVSYFGYVIGQLNGNVYTGTTNLGQPWNASFTSSGFTFSTGSDGSSAGTCTPTAE